MKSIFYIPAHNTKYYKALSQINPDYFVLDLEDSIGTEYVKTAIENILHKPYWLRENVFIRLRSIQSDIVNEQAAVFEKYKNIVLPKVETVKQLDSFFNEINNNFSISEYQFILLIETPIGVLNVEKIFEKYSDLILGVGFGSYDYCNCINARHILSSYSMPRNKILMYAKAYNKFCLDVATTNLKDAEKFQKECREGFDMGFDLKPILHPWQFEQFIGVQFYSDDEIIEAKNIYKYFNENIRSDITALRFNDRILEKPHIDRINRIIKYLLKTKKI